MAVKKITAFVAFLVLGLSIISASAWAVASLEITATNGQNVLPGQTISLFSESGTEVEQDQKRGGVTYFSDLEPGTYTVKSGDEEIRTITILPDDTVKRIAVVVPAALIGTSSSAAAAVNQTGNTAYNIHNAEAAADVSDAVTNARNAIASGDKAAYDRAMNQLKDIEKFFNATAKSDGVLGNSAEAAADRDTVKTLRSDLRSGWADAKASRADRASQPARFGAGSNEDQRRNSLHIGMRGGQLRLSDTSNYLGFENGGVQTLGVVSTENRGRFFGMGAEFRTMLGVRGPNLFNVPNKRRSLGMVDMFAGVDIAESEIEDNIGTVEPNGNIMLLPGVGAGPNPTGFAAGVNPLTNAMFSYDMEAVSFRGGFGQTRRFPNANGRIRPYLGLQYSEYRLDQMFTGSVAGVDFSYNSRVENNVISPFLGLETSFRPSFLQGFQSPIELGGHAEYRMNFNSVDGTDTLSVTGFMPGTANLDENDTTHSFGAGAGITINPDGAASVTVGGRIDVSGNAMELERTGQQLTQVDFGRAVAATGEVRFRFRF